MKTSELGAEEKLDNLPDNVLLRIFIKAGYKGRLTAMQGVRPQYCKLIRQVVWPAALYFQGSLAIMKH